MRSTLRVLAVTLIAAAPLAAQQQMGAMNDPTNKVKGSGTLPAGWMMRYDPPRGNAPVPAMNEINFVPMGTGYHFTTGPAAIYWNPKDAASGEYLVSATFANKKSLGHEAFGIFIGGKNLQDSTQSYTYLAVKPCRSRGDCKEAGAALGEVLISQRTSNGRPTALLAATHNGAVHPDDPTDGHATNTLAIHVAKDSVHFIVNDKLVAAFPKSQIPTDGLTGIRINHNIDVHVDWKGVSK